MDSGEIRRVLGTCLFGLLLVTSFFRSSFPLGLVTVAVGAVILCFNLGMGINSVTSSIFPSFSSGIYWSGSADNSYENLLYQDDMDRAKRLAREGRWTEVIMAYREIVRKAPGQFEPRFNLARAYQEAGHPGLAIGEYHGIIKLNKMRETRDPFALESERAISELKKLLSAEKV